MPNDIPEDVKKLIVSMSTSQIISGRGYNPIADKIKPETLDKIVDKHDERGFKDKASDRKNTSFLFVFVLIFIFAVIVVLKDGNEDLLKIILPLLIGLLSGGSMGAFGGYNWGYKKGREKAKSSIFLFSLNTQYNLQSIYKSFSIHQTETSSCQIKLDFNILIPYNV